MSAITWFILWSLGCFWLGIFTAWSVRRRA